VDEAVAVEVVLLCAEVVEEASVVEADSEAAMVEEATAEEDLHREDEVSVEEGIGAAAVLASRHTKALARNVSRTYPSTNMQAL
jgi:hypothetical protein